MKKAIVLAIFFVHFGYAQNDTIKRFSCSLNGNFAIGIGDNFLRKGYNNNFGMNTEVQFYINKIFFVGVGLQYNEMQVVNKNLIGQFGSANVLTNYMFIGIRQKLKPNKYYLEHRFGYGEVNITNSSIHGESDMTGNSFIYGSKFFYKLNPHFDIHSGFDFRNSCYNIKLDGPYHDFYTNSKQFTILFGVRVLFGVKIKKSYN